MHESDKLDAVRYGVLYCNGQPLGKMSMTSIDVITEDPSPQSGPCGRPINIPNQREATVSITMRAPRMSRKRLRKLLMSYGVPPRDVDRCLPWIRRAFPSYGWAHQGLLMWILTGMPPVGS